MPTSLGLIQPRSARCSIFSATQIAMIKHALTFRPEKLVYSVCSMHREEGEEVVEAVLEDSDYELEDISRHWASGGYPEFKFSSKVIRCSDSETVGFFIALFIRKS
jgi:25S rRNA (cytosine2278-C5)-methyltransferase